MRGDIIITLVFPRRERERPPPPPQIIMMSVRNIYNNEFVLNFYTYYLFFYFSLVVVGSQTTRIGKEHLGARVTPINYPILVANSRPKLFALFIRKQRPFTEW